MKAKKSLDVLGLTLFFLPLLDACYDLYYGHSVVFRPLVETSLIMAVYVYLMYYEKLIVWLLQKHLGIMCKGSSFRAGAEVYRFSVNMSRVEECLSDLKAQTDTAGPPMTAAHIAVKALGVALDEKRHMHGVLLSDRLYRSPHSPVDVSVSESSGVGDHAGIFLHNVNDVSSQSASIFTIAQEVACNKPHHGANMSAIRLLFRAMHPFVPTYITEQLLVHTNSAMMACLLMLGEDVSPFGAARVVSVLSTDEDCTGDSSCSSISSTGGTGADMTENEIDFSVLPMTSSVTSTRRGLCVPPVTLTLGYGGVKFIPVQHQERKIVRKFRVMNVSVCLHEVLTSSPGCTLQERQEFIAKLKSLLNNPKQLVTE
jgi:hypothetical protein